MKSFGWCGGFVIGWRTFGRCHMVGVRMRLGSLCQIMVAVTTIGNEIRRPFGDWVEARSALVIRFPNSDAAGVENGKLI